MRTTVDGMISEGMISSTLKLPVTVHGGGITLQVVKERNSSLPSIILALTIQNHSLALVGTCGACLSFGKLA